ncbi:helix-turn-helix domain-containing protein [Chloroflexota bacterium]
MQKEYLTIAEAAKLLNYSDRTIRDWCIKGKLPGAFRLGNARKWHIPLKSLKEIEKESLAENRQLNEEVKVYNTSSTLNQAALAYQHDVDLFRKADSILNEKDIGRLVWSFKSGNEIHEDHDKKLGEFFALANLPSTQYLIPELNEAYLRFVVALDGLHKFICFHFDGTGDLRPGIDSELFVRNPERYKWRWDEDTWKRYHNLEKALHKLADRVSTTYRDYRSLITQILKVSPLSEENNNHAILQRDTGLVRDHDITVFQKLDSIFGEQDVRNMTSNLVNNRMLNKHAIMIYESRWYLDQEKYKYIDTTISDQCNRLLKTIDILSDFIGKRFFTIDSGHIDYTTLLGFPHWYEGEDEGRQEEFRELADALSLLNDNFIDAYKEYRATIREILFI